MSSAAASSDGGSSPALNRPVNLEKYAWFSIAVSLVVFGLKIGAWRMTDSVGLLSDALESIVNIVAAVVALFALKTAARPPDEAHNFGHGKAEYFSSMAEGVLILVAALVIIKSAVGRLIEPQPLDNVGIGLAVSAVASALNGFAAYRLIRAGKKHRSIVLEADGKHLLTDVWTSAGVIIGVGLVLATGWLRLDPIIAILVAINIVFTGLHLIKASSVGLLDAALPPEDLAIIDDVLQRHTSDEVHFHQIQTRQAGQYRFITMHVLVPGAWTVQQGHDLLEHVESHLKESLPFATIYTHLEPLEDPRAWEDQHPGSSRLGVSRTERPS